MTLSYLFSPGKIGTLTLKNRVILPPMGSGLADQEGYISQKLIDYHVTKVKGGCGMNILEVSAVHPTTKAPRHPRIYDDSFIPGLARLAKAIQDAGGKACIQLWHAGRQISSRLTGSPLLAPSPIPCPAFREMPRELTRDEIKELVVAFGDAAIRAQKAGFDALELHGGHGYLISQFMSPFANQRTDEYGGSLENRARFALEIIEDVRKKVGREFPLLYRLSANEYVPGGITIRDTEEIVVLLEKAGVDAVHVSSGGGFAPQYNMPPLDVPVAFNAENAAAVKARVSMAVISAVRINDPMVANQIIEEGKADFVSIGRGQVADPEFCNKARAGDFDSIIKCIGCNQGCVDRPFIKGLPIGCLRNPAAGREKEYELTPAEQKKRVLVVGGGPAGLEAATTLRRRGHQVILIEKRSRLGGQLFLAGAAPRKKEIADAALQMGRIAGRAGVDIRLSTGFSRDLLEEIKPDEIVLATGSRPFIPNVPGKDRPHVVTAHEILEGSKNTGNSVAVIGGGLVGLEVAEFLCSEGKQVVIIEMLGRVAQELGFTRKPFAMKFLKEHDIQVYVNAKCVEIKDGSVVVEQDGEVREIENIDSVVMATGVKPDNKVEEMLRKMDFKYHVIGDAKEARTALEAIWEGAEAGREI